jgi:hypothetical protein
MRVLLFYTVMTKQSRWVRMAGLTVAMASQQLAFPFNKPASMLVEELVALATQTGNELSIIERKVGALIIGDYLAGTDYLRQVLDTHKSNDDHTYLIRRAEDLFVRSYYRLTKAGMQFEGGSSAGMCAMLYCLVRDYDEAILWFRRSEQAYLEAEKIAKAPSSVSDAKTAIFGTSTVVGLLASGGLFTGGLLTFVAVGVNITIAISTANYEASDIFKKLQRKHEAFLEETKKCALFMQNEAKSVLIHVFLASCNLSNVSEAIFFASLAVEAPTSFAISTAVNSCSFFRPNHVIPPTPAPTELPANACGEFKGSFSEVCGGVDNMLNYCSTELQLLYMNLL